MAGLASPAVGKLRLDVRRSTGVLALLLGGTILSGGFAHADTPCTLSGVILTCTGDQSDGVTAATPIETLEINTLSEDISPAAGTAGVSYLADNGTTLLSNTGTFSIITTDADGIRVGATAGDLYVNHNGTVTATGGRGIFASADNGEAVIEGAGAITSTLDAISTNPRGGAAALTWSGNITSMAGQGIFLRADNGGASVSGSGVIDADLGAIIADSRGASANTSLDWTGNITSRSGTAVELDAADGGVSAQGTGTVTAQVNGFDLDARGVGGNASLNWTGAITANTGYAARVYSANGGADARGSGTVTSELFGFHVETDRNGQPASLNWSGDITSRTGFGVLVETADGAATTRGDGAVTAALDALTSNATGGDAVVDWTGTVTSTAGNGIVAISNSGGASVRGSGTVTAVLDGISATNTSTSTATVNWDGDISSTTRRGANVFSSSGPANLRGTGAVSGGTDAVRIENRGGQTAALDWTGNLSGRTGYGGYVFSSNGPVSATGTGAVSGGANGLHLETQGNATAALNWNGAITSTGANGVFVTSARGAASSTTTGDITAATGGIHVLNGTADTGRAVAVTHTGNITAGGVGVEARSPVAPVSVRVTGDMQTGSFGIFAESLGNQTVSVEQTGTLAAQNTGIQARSATGSVSVSQNGALTAVVDGINAQGTGSNTVFVRKEGDLSATGRGIVANSATGAVTAQMLNGNITSGGTGIVATNTGNTTVTAEMTGNITAGGAGVDARSSNGQVYSTVTGTVVARGDGVSAINTGSGEVGVTQAGDVTAGGNGLVARSATGNATATLTSGTVAATQNGFSVGGFGKLSANIAAGATVVGGTGFSGVFFDTGLQNTVTNRGTIRNSGGVNQFAIRSEGNDTLVENFGTISGNVALGPWANDFNNYAGAVLETGTIFNIATGNTLTSAGTLSPGGTGAVTVTALTGNLETVAGNTLLLDLDMTSATAPVDRLNVSGTASLAGNVGLNFVRASNTPQSFTFVATGGGVTSQTLALIANPLVSASIETINGGQDVQVTISDVTIAPTGLTGIAVPVAAYFQRALAAGGGGGAAEIAAAILNTGTLAGAQQTFEEVAPSAQLDAVTAEYRRSLAFADSLMSCSVPSGLNAAVAEGTCDWLRLSYSTLSQDSTGGTTAQTDSFMFARGLQRNLDNPDWRIGAAFGLSNMGTTNANGDSSFGTTFHLGASLKYAPTGRYTLSAGLTGSWGGMSTTRFATIGGATQRLVGNYGFQTYNLKLRGAYLFGSDSFFVKPQMDLNATLVRSDAFTETGGSAALTISGLNDVIFSASPAVEFGTNRRYEDGGVLRAFARFGTTIYSQNGVSLTGRFATDTSGVAGFTVNNSSDTQVWNLAAGFTAFDIGGWSAEAQYNWNVASRSSEHFASIKLRTNF